MNESASNVLKTNGDDDKRPTVFGMIITKTESSNRQRLVCTNQMDFSSKWDRPGDLLNCLLAYYGIAHQLPRVVIVTEFFFIFFTVVSFY